MLAQASGAMAIAGFSPMVPGTAAAGASLAPPVPSAAVPRLASAPRLTAAGDRAEASADAWRAKSSAAAVAAGVSCAVVTRPLRKVRRSRAIAAAAGSGGETSSMAESAEKHLLNNYGKRSLAFVRGDGHRLVDADGNSFLDFTAGIAVNCLGHSDSGWIEAVSKQAQLLVHTSNLYLNPEQVKLGEKLTQLSFADKAFFCNSGTEANEAAIKFTRKFHVASGKPRERFIAFEDSFHGRTMGALALTWKEAYKTPFQPLMPSVDFLKFNETSGLDAIDEETCAVFVEPMQGEGGVIPATAEFLGALRRRCDEVGALLVYDEVQCGLGRSGQLFGYEVTGVTPDVLTLAKPLAGGLPIGAVLLTERVAAAINPGDHGSTFAGAPLICAAANYTLSRVSDQAFLSNVREMGELLRSKLSELAEPHGMPVRGLGLLTGVVFPTAESCGAVQKAAQERGLLVLTAGKGNVLRIAPALTITAAEVDEAVEVLGEAFQVAMQPAA